MAVYQSPIDKNGDAICVGAHVRLLCLLPGDWLDELPADERQDVLTMIGEIFKIEKIDEHGYPWIRKSWTNETDGTCHSHSIALEPQEMKLVDDDAL